MNLSVEPSSPRLRALDALRFAAALAVVMFHFTARTNSAWGGSVDSRFPHLGHATAYGAIGVHVFFLISGFVILMSAWGRSLPEFIAARVARLFPAFWLAVAITSFLLLVIRPATSAERTAHLGAKDAVANLSMMYRALGVIDVDGVYWTLWEELKFYLIIALLLHVGLTRGRVLALAVLWPVIGQIAEKTDSRLVVELLTPNYAPLFAIGMMLFLIHREGPSAAPILIAFLNWTFVLALCDGPYRSLITDSSTWDASGTVVAGIITAGIIAIVLLARPRASRLDWRWLTTLGTLTYPLYLLHQQLGWWLISIVHGRVGAPTYVTLAIVVLGLCLASAVIHRWVERPIAPLLRRSVRTSLAQE